MSASSITDWIEALSTLVAAATAVSAGYLGIRTFQHQRTSNDVQLALGIFSDINGYWDRIVDSESRHYEYDVGQILAQFEVAASLFNKAILTKDALPILKDHIVESFTHIKMSDEGKGIVQACQSSPTTFEELNKFLKKHLPTALNAASFREGLA